jgi:ketosteroid isomerase-like protein
MPEDNKAILRRANEAIAAGDIEGFLEWCTDDTEWTMVGDKTLRGKAEVRQWLVETYVNPPMFDVANWIAEGDFLAVYGTITVTDRGGTATRSSYCDVWRIRDGKLAELRAYAIVTR